MLRFTTEVNARNPGLFAPCSDSGGNVGLRGQFQTIQMILNSALDDEHGAWELIAERTTSVAYGVFHKSLHVN